MTFFFEQTTVVPAELIAWLPIRLSVRNESRQLISVADITLLEAEINYCRVYLGNGQELLTTKTLKYHYDQLPANWFIRIHRNCVINRRFIEKIEFIDGNYQIDMTIGKVVPVARRRWGEIRRQLLGDHAVKSRSIKASFR